MDLIATIQTLIQPYVFHAPKGLALLGEWTFGPLTY